MSKMEEKAQEESSNAFSTWLDSFFLSQNNESTTQKPGHRVLQPCRPRCRRKNDRKIREADQEEEVLISDESSNRNTSSWLYSISLDEDVQHRYRTTTGSTTNASTNVLQNVISSTPASAASVVVELETVSTLNEGDADYDDAQDRSGQAIWRSSLLVIKWLQENSFFEQFLYSRNGGTKAKARLRILELGCGTGVLGIAVAKLLEQLQHNSKQDHVDIILTDHCQSCGAANSTGGVLALAEKNVARNFPKKNEDDLRAQNSSSSLALEVMPLSWGEDVQSDTVLAKTGPSSSGFDLILCADLIYDEAQFLPLLSTLLHLTTTPTSRDEASQRTVKEWRRDIYRRLSDFVVLVEKNKKHDGEELVFKNTSIEEMEIEGAEVAGESSENASMPMPLPSMEDINFLNSLNIIDEDFYPDVTDQHLAEIAEDLFDGEEEEIHLSSEDNIEKDIKAVDHDHPPARGPRFILFCFQKRSRREALFLALLKGYFKQVRLVAATSAKPRVDDIVLYLCNV
ncbi:unnamed protein product [Amoebophrya sp. A25]|nr:unnamed protein product [Amoebophrya sp. A25]|eukprot:GSA25T00004093001.1